MPESRKMPTQKAIREHWRDWAWKRHRDDPDDGYCFACGLQSSFTLERAHIVARCNGGPDTVENLHLLCHTCHRASEYIEGDDYFQWLEEWTVFDRAILEMAKVGIPLHSRLLKHLTVPEHLLGTKQKWWWPDYIARPTSEEYENVDGTV